MVIRYRTPPQRRAGDRRPKRSPAWRSLRRWHLLRFPACAVCGSRAFLIVHHIVPVSVDPSRELDPSNLVTLCSSPTGRHGCHLKHGHRGSFHLWNPLLIEELRAQVRR